MKVVARWFISSTTERGRMTDGGAWSDGAPGSGGGGFDEWRKEMSRRLKGLELRPAWGKSLGKDFGLLKWFGPN
jgi:hypothetical protein